MDKFHIALPGLRIPSLEYIDFTCNCQGLINIMPIASQLLKMGKTVELFANDMRIGFVINPDVIHVGCCPQEDEDVVPSAGNLAQLKVLVKQISKIRDVKFRIPKKLDSVFWEEWPENFMRIHNVMFVSYILSMTKLFTLEELKDMLP